MFKKQRHLLFIASLSLAFLGFACGKKSSSSSKHAGKAQKDAGEKTDEDNLKAKSNSPDSAEYGVVRTALNRVRIGDKFYATSVLSQIFGPESLPTVNKLVLANTGAFGGPCDQLGRQGVNFCGSHTSYSNAPMVPTSMATREGFRMRACEAVTQNDQAVKFAVSQVNTDGTDKEPTDAEVTQSYQLFFPGIEPAPEVVTALKGVVDAAGQDAPLESWRYLFLTLCLTPDWQLL